MKTATIYTDGSITKNPGGQGGWGFVLLVEDRVIRGSGGFRSTTNNRMEMMAAIMGLYELRLQPRVDNVLVVSDSKYVVDGVDWSIKWRSNDWKNNRNEDVANKDLWRLLLGFTEKHNAVFKWVKGHAGNEYNEIADVIAGMAARQNIDKLLIDKGYEQ